VAIEVKFCRAKRTRVPVGHAKFDVNRCNESLLRGEKLDFWPVSKFNTGSLPLCGILPVTNHHPEGNAVPAGYCHYYAYYATIATYYAVELITILIATIRNIWHNSAADFFAFWKISAANLRILWRHLPK